MENYEEVSVNTEKKSKLKEELIDWAKSIIGAAIIVGIVFGFFISSIRVDGSSMVPTLHHEDRLIAYKFMYKPKQGDIVILDENSGLNTALVKRVVALEGQTVDVTEEGKVLVDGEELEEDYIMEPHTKHNTGFHKYPVTVPEDCVFVMGDNRNHSTDSRFSQISFVDTDTIIGKVVFRMYPFSDIGIVK